MSRARKPEVLLKQVLTCLRDDGTLVSCGFLEVGFHDSMPQQKRWEYSHCECIRCFEYSSAEPYSGHLKGLSVGPAGVCRRKGYVCPYQPTSDKFVLKVKATCRESSEYNLETAAISFARVECKCGPKLNIWSNKKPTYAISADHDTCDPPTVKGRTTRWNTQMPAIAKKLKKGPERQAFLPLRSGP